MKKSIVFIVIIFLLLLGTTVVLATAEGIVVKATVENDRIYIGDKTKVGFTATITDPAYPEFCITLDSYNFANNGFVDFNKDCVSVKYSTDNSKIAAVDDNGTVTGISAGTVTITQDITLNIQLLKLTPDLMVNDYGGFGGSCQLMGFYSKIFSYNGTYTRKVKITVVPDDRLYLCRPGKEPTPVKISMNAASLEVDRLSAGDSMNVDFSVTMTELNDPAVKYTFNKYDLFLGTALDFENLTVEYSSDNESVATVNRGGLVTGISEGWANITINIIFKPEILGQEGSNARIRKARLAVKPSDTAGTVRFTRQISILVSPSRVMNNVILAQSKSRQLSAGAGTPKWAVSDPSVAKIDKTGSITGLRPGRTYVVYYMEEFKKIDNWSGMIKIPVVGSVTVYPVMAIHPEIINVYIGTPTTLKVDFDGFYSGEKAGTWSIADKSIASVDQSGRVTGIKAGKATATFTITATGAQTDCTVVVAEPPFRIEPNQLSIYNGDKEKLTVTYDSGYTGKKSGTWSVGDSTIVSVEDNSTAPVYISKKHTIPGTVGAKVTGLKPGTTTVTFTDSATGARRDCIVVVKSSFTIAPDPLTVYTGETGRLTVAFDDGFKGQRFGSWSVDDNTVASIDQNGVVTGKKAGTAIVTFASGSAPAGTDVQDRDTIKVGATIARVKSAYDIVKTVSIEVKQGSFTVNFDPNGGSTKPDSVTVRHDSTVVRPADPSISGKRFLGWYNAPLGGSTQFAGNILQASDINAKKWDFTNDKVTADMTLYAWWGLILESSSDSSLYRPLPSWPHITGMDTIDLTEGYENYDQSYTFSGYPAPTYGISDTEPNTANAVFAGTTLTIPAGLSAAGSPYFVTLTANNSSGTVTKTVTVNVSPAESLPTITGPDTIDLTEGYDGIDQIYTFGGYPEPTCGISDTEPNTANAILTGDTLTIPEGLVPGSYEVTLYASNSAGTVTKTITVNVSPAESLPTISGPDTINLMEGFDSFDQEYTFGGYPEPTEYGISSTEPNTANAVFAGTTLAISGDGFDMGSYEVTLYATNAVGTTTKTVTVNVYSMISIQSVTEIEFSLSSDDNRIIASGGAGGPYTFSIAQGSMPDGLTLDPDGKITGSAETGFYDPVAIEISDCVGNSITTHMMAVLVRD